MKGRARVITVSAQLLQTRFQMQTECLCVKTPALLLFICIFKETYLKNMFMISNLKYFHDYLQITTHLPSSSTFPLPFPAAANSSSWLQSDEHETCRALKTQSFRRLKIVCSPSSKGPLWGAGCCLDFTKHASATLILCGSPEAERVSNNIAAKEPEEQS